MWESFTGQMSKVRSTMGTLVAITRDVLEEEDENEAHLGEGAGAGGAAGADAAVFTNGHSKSKAPLSMKEELEVYKKLLEETQFKQVEFLREYQKAFAEKEEQVLLLKHQVQDLGGTVELTAEEEAKAAAMPRNGTAVLTAAGDGGGGGAGSDTVTVTDYYKLNAQKEQLEKSLMQSSHTVKEYISQANKSKLELYSALEARDKALREIDDLKDQLRVQNEVVENVARMKTDIHTKQARDESAMDELVANYSRLTEESEARFERDAKLISRLRKDKEDLVTQLQQLTEKVDFQSKAMDDLTNMQRGAGLDDGELKLITELRTVVKAKEDQMTLLAAQLHELQAARDEAAMLAASSKPIEAKAKATRAEAEEAEKEVAKLRVQLERVKSQSKKDLLQAAAHVEEMTMAYERLENELAKATTEVEKLRARGAAEAVPAQRLAELQGQHAAELEQAVARVRQEMESEHARALEAALAEAAASGSAAAGAAGAAARQELEAVHAQALQAAAKEHEAALARVREELTKEHEDALATAVASTREELETKHATALEAARKQHEDALAAAKAAGQAALLNANSGTAEAVAAVRQELEAQHEAALEAARKQHEDALGEAKAAAEVALEQAVAQERQAAAKNLDDAVASALENANGDHSKSLQAAREAAQAAEREAGQAALAKAQADAQEALRSALQELREELAAEHKTALEAAQEATRSEEEAKGSAALQQAEEQHAAALREALAQLEERLQKAAAVAQEEAVAAANSKAEEAAQAATAKAAADLEAAQTAAAEAQRAALASAAAAAEEAQAAAVAAAVEEAQSAADAVRRAALAELRKELEASIEQLKAEHAEAVASLRKELEAQTAAAEAAKAEALEVAAKEAAEAQAAAVAACEAKCGAEKEAALAAAAAAAEERIGKVVEETVERTRLENVEALAEAKREADRRVEAEQAKITEYRDMYAAEAKQRKLVHNQLLELRGNIRVFCRVRPVVDAERRTGRIVDVTSYPIDDDIVIRQDDEGMISKRFEFDRVFKADSTQENVFDELQGVVDTVVDGYNVCIFAYGQTGSGKTYTMEGPADNRGVYFRALSQLFALSSSRSDEEVTFKLSMLEIYNESCFDLLAPPPKRPEDRKRLDIRQRRNGDVIVPDLLQQTVTSEQEVHTVMAAGGKNRALGSHDMNEHSSRSHLVLTVYVTSVNKVTGVTSKGKLHLIDLAGSERISKTAATGDRLKEAQAINKSLSALGDVVAALASKKKSHVPFRNSKLTFLLQDSLCGQSKVLMFVNISPVVYNVSETMCSLNFASRCRSVALGSAKKNTESGEVAKLKRKVAELSAMVKSGGRGAGGGAGARG